MATNNVDELRNLAATLGEAKQEINLARQQSTKPEHLFVRASRAAAQAARAVAAAVDLGFSNVWPEGSLILSSLRHPGKPIATLHSGDFKAELRSINVGSGCNVDGSLRDDTALALWQLFISPSMRRRHAALKADAGGFDFPKMKTDEQGRFIGRDGKPLRLIEKVDPETGKGIGWELDGPIARVTDDYNAVDALEHFRCLAADWVDACDAAADLLRNESIGPRGARILRDGLSEPRRKRRGRRKADYTTIQREAKVAEEWKQARGKGVYKAVFAKDKGMTFDEFDRLLDRVAARNRHSE